MTYGRTQWLVHMQRRGKDVSLILAKKSSKGLPSNQKTGWRVYSFSKLWKWIGLLSASFWSSPLYSTEYRNHRIRDAELGSHCLSCCLKLGMLGVPKLQQARVHPINHLNNVVLCIHCLPGLTPDVSEAGPPVVYKRRARGNGLIRKSTQEEPYWGYERSLLVLQTGKLRSRKEVSRSSRGVTDRPASLPGRLSLYHMLPTVRLRFFSELHERIWNLEDNTLWSNLIFK